ncbi:hypothetical protein M0R45_035825 [Rubus argutus]|uniref:Uncharacterized protein n=1 Tax=Rubus argutus TaxID=59490 RepID=A0AAW1VYU6_RUBAR
MKRSTKNQVTIPCFPSHHFPGNLDEQETCCGSLLSHTHQFHFQFQYLRNHIPTSIISLLLLCSSKPKPKSPKDPSDSYLKQQEREGEKEKEEGTGSNGGDEMGKNGRSIFSNIRWGDLLLDPDPNNILAVGLTGLLTWASVQYSFIAAVLLFILITLL